MIGSDSRTRVAALILAVALLASIVVAVFRVREEAQTHRVEIAMDYTAFVALARSYNYNPSAFLIELRRAGLTSLALTESLGVNAGDQGKAYASTGAALANQARLSPLTDPLLAGLVKSGKISPDALYLAIYDPGTYRRYRQQLALHFDPSGIHVLRSHAPWLIELHTQIDYFNALGLGIASDQLALAKKLHLLVIPRFQNDERFGQPEMEAAVDDVLAQDHLVSTVMFFGLRNEVFGYPDQLPAAASVFKQHGPKSRRPFNFGAIETYDDSQIQKGSDTLAKSIPGQTVRVQAIAKAEMDKIGLDELIARYVLGVRERNVRVAYMRPWEHTDGTLTIEQTNVEMIDRLSSELKHDGFTLGRATPVGLYRGNNAVLVGLASLAVPSIFVLLLGAFGWYRRSWAIAAYAVTVLFYLAGFVSHHDLFARSVIALAGALLFETAAFYILAPAFSEMPALRLRDQLLRSLGWTLAAAGVALLGALVVVGIMSSPLAMEEIERFRGVRLVLGLPPLIALALYLFDRRFHSGVERPSDVFTAPVRAYQLLVAIVIIAGGVLMLMRSGNQSDIAPTHFEIALRQVLTTVLSVRPRFKEFVIGFPLLMLLPALSLAHRRLFGWFFALGIGVGIGDIVDTFSHLHTPIAISLQRIGNGFVLGAIIGAIAVAIYRRFALRTAS